MYRPIELARFTLAEFNRNLEGLTEDDATTRITKSDSSQMNAVSWTVGHIAGHWHFINLCGGGHKRPSGLRRFSGTPEADPTPPPLGETRSLLADAEGHLDWLEDADDGLMSSKRDLNRRDMESVVSTMENVGTSLMRVMLHTWFHIGEINAMRQLLGHPEIGFLGDITEHLEWRGGRGVETGFTPAELARYAISEFDRGLAGLTGAEAETRVAKADGTEMNAISWTMSHVNTHWFFIYRLMTDNDPPHLDRVYFGAAADPTPPPMPQARNAFASAKALTSSCLETTDDEFLSSKKEFGPLREENLGTQLMRAVLHTWFHTGEVNAVRQTLGHAEIQYVGDLIGRLEWRSGRD